MNRIATALAFLSVLLVTGTVLRPAAVMQNTPDAAPPPQLGERGDRVGERRPRGFSDRAGAEAPMELNGEFADRILMIADEIDPDMAKRLRAVCDHDPAEFARAIRTSGSKLVGLAELQMRDPKLYELKVHELKVEGQVARLEARLDEAFLAGDEKELDSLQNDLRMLLMVQLALTIKARGDYLQRLQEHVLALQEEIDREATHFDETVDSRLREIVDRARAQAEARTTREDAPGR